MNTDIQRIKGDMKNFKALVLAGMPKLMTGEAFASEDEQIAVSAFILEQGMNLESPVVEDIQPARNEEGLLVLPDRLTFDNILGQALMDSLNRVFSGKYGI